MITGEHLNKHGQDLYQVSFKHIKPQQAGEKFSDYWQRSNKHRDVVCSSFQEALDAAQTGMNDYVITGVRRVGPVIVVDNPHVGSKSTPDIAITIGAEERNNFKVGLTD